MKVILKLLAALAAITGVVYVIATYGEQIVAWAKKLIGTCPCSECTCDECDCAEEETVEEEVVEEAPVEEAVVEEVVVEEAEPIAEEADFEA